MEVKMDFLICVLINGALVILHILANIFHLFCTVRPPHGREGIKQPLKLLLWSLICCKNIYVMSVIAMLFSRRACNDTFNRAAYLLVVYTFSVTSSVWLNFFYYSQILPAQRALFIWIKRSIKSIIYYIFLVDRVFFMFIFTVIILESLAFEGVNRNFTMDHKRLHIFSTSSFETKQQQQQQFCFSMKLVHFFFCVRVILWSSDATVIYLCRHMRRLIRSGGPFSCPQLHSQMRVSITAILRGVLYLLCAVWILVHFLSPCFSTTHFSEYIFYTITTMSTVNLGASQAGFRQKVANIWLRAAQGDKVLCK